MRYVSPATLVVFVASFLPTAVFGQIVPANLSITNYRLVSEDRLDRTHSLLTYSADLVNNGPAIPAVTATVRSLLSSIEVQSGLGNLHFPPTPAGGTTSSTNTFAIIADRTGNTSFSNLEWSFLAPVANAGPNQTGTAGVAVTLNGSGSTNPIGIGTLQYFWAFTSRPAGSTAVLQNMTTVSPNFTPDVQGVYVILMSVSNGLANDSASVTVTVGHGNTTPVAIAGVDQTVAAGTTVTLNGTNSHDVDGDPLTYSWTLVTRPPGSTAVLIGATTTSPTFVADKKGQFVAQLVVNDGKVNSLPSSVTISTSNTKPVAVAGTNQAVAQPGLVQLDGSASSDADGDPITYRWSLNTLPALSTATLSSTTAVKPTFTADIAGIYVAQLIVNDGTDDSLGSTVTITVGKGNTAPVADAGPGQTVKAGATVTLNGSGSKDVDGDPLTFSWTLTTRPPGSSATLTGATTVSPTFVADQPGQYIAQLIVNDGKVNSSNTPTVTISSTNTPPVSNAGPNQVVFPPILVQLDGSGSNDVDGNTLTYRWSLTTVPSGSTAVLSSTTAVKPTFTADLAGTYIAQLIVNDGFVDSLTPSTVTITSNAPLQPTASAGSNQTVARGAVVSLTGTGTDPQSLPLTFHWSLTSKPLGSTAALSNPAISNPTFVADLPGSYLAQLIVNNGLLDSAPSMVTIKTTNTQPVANAGPDRFVATGSTVTLDGTGSRDVDNDSLTYSWTFSSRPAGSAALLVGSNTPTPTFTADVAGAYVAQLIVNDGQVNSDPDSVVITAGVNAISVTPSPLNLATNSPGTLTITIVTAPSAGSGGQIITLSALDKNIATTPATVTIPEGATSVTATVTPVNVGSTTVFATAAGFQPGSATVNVGQPGISLSFSASNVGVSKTVTGTVTLTGAAPAAGVTVALGVNDNTLATFPATVDIAGGATTGTFTVTGVKAGTANFTASSSGYANGAATLTVVNLGSITLQSSAVVAPGQTLPFSVTLATIAPVGGVTITLTSGDTNILTVSPTVFIPEGALTPTTAAQITGVNFGSTTITASAGGFTGDSKTVQVAANLSFAQPNFTIGVGGTVNLVVSLTGAAPTGGVTVNLVSGNPAIASVPATVSIPQGVSTVNVPVLGLSIGGPVTLTASSSVAGIASGVTNITVVQGVSITTTTLPAGVVGTAYSQQVTANGGVAPLNYTATGLPAGLTISSTGLIAGTPTASGTSSAVITVTDSNSPKASDTKTISLIIVDPLVIQTATLPNGVLNTPYPDTAVSATGGTGPYTFTATGLPAGLVISTTGHLTGTPTAEGPNTVVITVTDSTNPHLTKTASISLVVGTNPAITTTTLPNGFVGTAYTPTNVAATGGTGPYTFTATGLPAGLVISSAGQITGTPTAPGTSSATFTVTDSSAAHLTGSGNISITILPGLTIQTTSLPNGIVGTAYTPTNVMATGGTSPYTFTATGLPAGLVISSAGQLTGTPTAAGASTATITVTDSTTNHLTATAGITITIIPALVIQTTSLPNGVVNLPYTAFQVAVVGGTNPYAFTATGLPAGLVISATGQITGTPTAASAGNAVITVTDSTNPKQTATATLPITIGTTPVINPVTLPNGVVGAVYTATTLTATGGTGPYSFTATGLPAGLAISPGGQIAGTPSAAGTSTAIVTVTDSKGLAGNSNFSITIITPVVITPITLPAGFVGAVYSAPSVTASGGTAPYTFTATGLPAGLQISAGGQITGTPTAAGPNSVILMVTDSSAPPLSATASASILINPGVSFTTTSLSAGMAGVPYSAQVSAQGGTAPYTFTATGLPPGTVISTSGLISGTPTVAGLATPSITATDSTSPTKLSATTTALTILIAPPQLTLPTLTLPNGFLGVPYNAQVTASGGTPPLTFSATNLPGNLSINPSTGLISGIPSTVGAFTNISVTVTDSTAGTHQTVTAGNLTISVAPPPPLISAVANVTVGQNLEAPVTFVLSAASGDPITVSVTSNSPNVLLVDSRTPEAIGCAIDQNGNCAGRFSINLPAGFTTFTVLAQGLASSGSATLTASAPGYLDGTATVTLAPSGFVLAGPNGVGVAFDSNPGVASQLQVTSERLDGNGVPVEIQPVRAFYQVDQNGKPILNAGGMPIAAGPVAVPLQNSNGSVGGPPSQVTINAGTNTGLALFSALSTPGSTVVTAIAPTGFSTPAGGANSVAITVKSSQIMPSNVTVGQGLEINTRFALQGAPLGNMAFLVTSKDPTRLKLSPDTTTAGAAQIIVTINAGFSTSPDFYVYGLANTGSVGYTVCQSDNAPVSPQCATSPVFGAADGTVTLTKSGFVLQSPFGQVGGDFFTSTLSGNSAITVLSAMLDSQGGYLGPQALAGGTTAFVNVTSGNTSVGTISTSPVTVAGGSGSSVTQFTPVGQGSTLISASVPAGFSAPSQFNSLNATVSLARITLDNGTLVGNKLQAVASIFLSVPNASVTLQVTSGAITLATTATGPSSTSITVPVTGNSATYFVRGLGSSGTATVSGTATNYISGTGTFVLSPSGFVIAGPGGEGSPFPDSIPLAGGPSPITLKSAVLDANFNFVMPQALAGGSSVSVPVTNQDATVGTFPATVTYPGGSDSVDTNFTPLKTGTTRLAVGTPSGFITVQPIAYVGVTINVQ